MRNALLAIGRLISSRPISSFLLVAYTWSWLAWVPSVLLYRRTGAFSLLALTIVAYGPTVAALIVTAVVDGRRGTGTLLRRYLAWRVGVRWYVAALCGLWIPTLATAGIYVLRGGSIGALDVDRLVGLPLLVVMALPNGPLAEELGWRGYLLPRIAAGTSLLRASVAVGVVWTFWHAPLFWAPAGSFISGAPVTVRAVSTFLVIVVGLSCFVAWVWSHTHGSVLLTILTHLSININALGLLFPGIARAQQQLFAVGIGMFWLFILAIILLERRSWTVVPGASQQGAD
jgi:membrane protease YdiL (CAAX protease family)